MGSVSREQQSCNPLSRAGLAEPAGLGLPMGGVFILEVVLVVPYTLLQEKKQA